MKRTITSIILVIIFVTSLVGCTTPAETETSVDEEVQSSFIAINKEKYQTEFLVYDSQTYIVYYYMNSSYVKKSSAYLCPYYSANGNLCRFNPDTGAIEEITR